MGGREHTASLLHRTRAGTPVLHLTSCLGLAWFMGRSPNMTFEPCGSSAESQLGFPKSLTAPLHRQANASCSSQLFFPFWHCPEGHFFIYISFFLKSVRKVMTRHCSAPRLWWWLTSRSPQETRESGMRQECWALLGAWKSWLWTRFWITDLKTGYILSSRKAGQLWGSKILFFKGESGAFFFFPIPFSQQMCQKETSLGGMPYLVLCFLGIVYSEWLSRWSSLCSPAPATTCPMVDWYGKAPPHGEYIQGGTLPYWKAELQSG